MPRSRPWKRSGVLLLAALVLSLAACTEDEEPAPPATEVRWRGPVGRAEVPGRRPPLDLKEVRAHGKDGKLLLEIRTSGRTDSFLEHEDADGRRCAAPVLSLFLDADQDTLTGGRLKAGGALIGERRGYDLWIEVQLGYQLARGDSVFDGKCAKGNGEGLVSFRVLEVKSETTEYGSEVIDDRAVADRHPDFCSLEAYILHLEIPYGELRLARGRTVRLAFKEEGTDRLPTKAFSGDYQLILE